MISTDKAKALLEDKLSQIDKLKNLKRFSPEYEKWHRDTSVAIERIFGKDTRHIKDFTGIIYYLTAFSTNTPDYKFDHAFHSGLDSARSVLESIIDELDTFGTEAKSAPALDPSRFVSDICDRFHLIVRQLHHRHASRNTLEVEDEYDVQDLLHALLHLYFDDIRAEEWTPSYAAGSSRIDFLLKNERIIVETKKTRRGLSERELADQLIIDIKRYQAHPNCEKLICFVYDPEGRLGNPRGIEGDLAGQHDALEVEILIRPI